MRFERLLPLISIILVMSGCGSAKTEHANFAKDDETSSAFKLLTQSSQWQLTDVIDIDFQAYHTQGLVKIDGVFYVSAVEIIEKNETYGETDNLWDFSLTRTPGKGRGWLFKFNDKGKLLAKTELTRGHAFHPGGIDYDGRYIWVSVAEYRPNSHSDIYRVDPTTMKANLSFRVNDHIGNIVHNLARNTFHGTSWGGRRMYEWQVELNAKGTGNVIAESWAPNPTHFIDYQDCQYQGLNYMLCSGLQKYSTPLGQIALGGIELIDISGSTPAPVKILPVAQYWDASKNSTLENFKPVNAELTVSGNPFWVEAIADGSLSQNGKKIMRMYFMPDRGEVSKLLIYDVSNEYSPN